MGKPKIFLEKNFLSPNWKSPTLKGVEQGCESSAFIFDFQGVRRGEGVSSRALFGVYSCLFLFFCFSSVCAKFYKKERKITLRYKKGVEISVLRLPRNRLEMYLGILIPTLEKQNNLLTNVNGASSKEK